ncbi:hypothetical protein BDZ45DRAFT_676602 [Acephala macrosclerotiorum]|nr:hypothetical protein BDZ45DRAFT_676602 [Acephala macrosclerotiorum]
MPTSKRKARKTKPKPQKRSEETAIADAPERSRHNEDAAFPSVFQTFETTATLSDGHCIVRKLEDGRYEILNLDSVEANVLGSIEFGRMIRGNETSDSGRLKALQDIKKGWKSTELKVEQALGSANQTIFRFLKLPIELRFRIYDMTISSDKKVRLGHYDIPSYEMLTGLQLRGTCRQIYDETRGFFWRNNIIIKDICKQTKLLVPRLTENLREVSWEWWNSKIKDPQTLRMFQDCKNLKILHVRLTKWSIYLPRRYYPTVKVQHLYRDEPAVAKFQRVNGFDELLRLRGLDDVTVKNDLPLTRRIEPADLSDEELNAFENFLKQKLTRPKRPDVIRETSAKKSKKTGKTTKKALAKELRRDLEGLL